MQVEGAARAPAAAAAPPTAAAAAAGGACVQEAIVLSIGRAVAAAAGGGGGCGFAPHDVVLLAAHALLASGGFVPAPSGDGPATGPEGGAAAGLPRGWRSRGGTVEGSPSRNQNDKSGDNHINPNQACSPSRTRTSGAAGPARRCSSGKRSRCQSASVLMDPGSRVRRATARGPRRDDGELGPSARHAARRRPAAARLCAGRRHARLRRRRSCGGARPAAASATPAWDKASCSRSLFSSPAPPPHPHPNSRPHPRPRPHPHPHSHPGCCSRSSAPSAPPSSTRQAPAPPRSWSTSARSCSLPSSPICPPPHSAAPRPSPAPSHRSPPTTRSGATSSAAAPGFLFGDRLVVVRRDLFRASFGDFPPRDLSAPPSAAGPSTSAAPPPAGGAAKRAYATRLDEERTAAAEKEKRRRLHEQVLRDGPPWYGHLNPPPGHFNPPGPLPVNPGPGGGYPGGLPVPLPGFVGGDFDRTPGFGPLHGGAPGFGPPPGFPGVPAVSHLRRRGTAPNFSQNLPV